MTGKRAVVLSSLFALSVLAVVALAAIVSRVPGASLAAGGVLLVGCLAALIVNVVKAARP